MSLIPDRFICFTCDGYIDTGPERSRCRCQRPDKLWKASDDAEFTAKHAETARRFKERRGWL